MSLSNFLLSFLHGNFRKDYFADRLVAFWILSSKLHLFDFLSIHLSRGLDTCICHVGNSPLSTPHSASMCSCFSHSSDLSSYLTYIESFLRSFPQTCQTKFGLFVKCSQATRDFSHSTISEIIAKGQYLEIYF
jgi:hypothetical protein